MGNSRFHGLAASCGRARGNPEVIAGATSGESCAWEVGLPEKWFWDHFYLSGLHVFRPFGWESAGFYMESDLSDVLACCVHRCESTPLIVNHRMRVITPIPGTASV